MSDNNAPQERISQDQLDEVLRKHRNFSVGKPGGARAVMKFKDLSGLDFRRIDLSGADFTGSNLARCNLSYGTYVGSAFYGCDLRDANLEGANFTRADMRGTNREGARLEHADLSTADLREGKVLAAKSSAAAAAMNTGLTGTRRQEKETRISSLDLSQNEGKEALRESNLVLKGAPNAESHRESSLDLSNRSGEDEPIRESRLVLKSDEDEKNQQESSLVLSAGNTDETRVSKLTLQGEDTSASAREALVSLEVEARELIAGLEQHAKWLTSNGQLGKQLILKDADLRRVPDLVRFPMTALRADRVDFSGLNLGGVHLQSAQLTSCNFEGTNLSRADLRGATLRACNLTRANLSKALLTPLQFGERNQPTDLSGSILEDTIIDPESLKLVRNDEGTP